MVSVGGGQLLIMSGTRGDTHAARIARAPSAHDGRPGKADVHSFESGATLPKKAIDSLTILVKSGSESNGVVYHKSMPKLRAQHGWVRPFLLGKNTRACSNDS